LQVLIDDLSKDLKGSFELLVGKITVFYVYHGLVYRIVGADFHDSVLKIILEKIITD